MTDDVGYKAVSVYDIKASLRNVRGPFLRFHMYSTYAVVQPRNLPGDDGGTHLIREGDDMVPDQHREASDADVLMS